MGRVLLVEDHADTRAVYSEVLREFGHEVLEAADGLDGIAAMETKAPSVVILDLQLPEMNGYEFLERVRASRRFADLPIIAVSGTATGRHALRAGADAYLQKPFHVDELTRAVERFTASA